MGRRPDYRLKLMDKETSMKLNDAGAAWKNEDASITVVLNPWVVNKFQPNLIMTLFPTKGT